MKNRVCFCLLVMVFSVGFQSAFCNSSVAAAPDDSSARQGRAPSFDCTKASTKPEQLICSNKELSEADLKLSQVYKQALNGSADKNALKKEQQMWIKNRRDLCADAPSMLQAYQERIASLEKGVPEPPKRQPVQLEPVTRHDLTSDKSGSPVVEGKYSVAGIDDDQAVAEFLRVLKQAVAKDQRDQVASMVHYPLRVNTGNGRSIKISNSAALLSSYEKVFTQKVKSAISAQKESDLFVKADGVMIGDGEVWFNLFGYKLLINAINT